MPDRQPNILLVMADQLTPFAVGAYGNRVVRTPHLDAPAARFQAEVLERWDPVALKQAVIADQDRRRLLDRALRQGRLTPWDYQPPRDDTRRYVRNHLDLNEVERYACFPRPADAFD